MTAAVEREADPGRPGRTAYRITGPTKGAVQDEIDLIMREIDDAAAGGFANFVGPLPIDSGYGALGEAIIYQPEGAA